MTENVRKVFDLLGVEPNEEFYITLNGDNIFSYKFKFKENLQGYCFNGEWRLSNSLLKILLNGNYKIVKLSKESKKKKLKDLTPEEYKKWKEKQCIPTLNSCNGCIFNDVICRTIPSSWVYHKDLYSDKFLDQELEVKE